MNLSLTDFIGRFLQHVPLPNSIRLRSYGLYHQNCKADLELCRVIFDQSPIEDPGFRDWQSLCEELKESHPERCPVCGKRLVCLGVFAGFRRTQAFTAQRQSEVPYHMAA